MQALSASVRVPASHAHVEAYQAGLMQDYFGNPRTIDPRAVLEGCLLMVEAVSLLNGRREADRTLTGWSVPLKRHSPRPRHGQVGNRFIATRHVGFLHVNASEHRHSRH